MGGSAGETDGQTEPEAAATHEVAGEADEIGVVLVDELNDGRPNGRQECVCGDGRRRRGQGR